MVSIIICKIQRSKLGLKKKCYSPILFYADDSDVVNDREDIKDMIKILREVARETDLEVSKMKSECIILNKKGDEVATRKIG